MTYLEFIKTLPAEQLHDFIFKSTNLMCLQHGEYNNEIWQIHCLGPYKGNTQSLGCRQCRIDWLNSEVGSVEQELIEKSLARRGGKTND